MSSASRGRVWWIVVAITAVLYLLAMVDSQSAGAVPGELDVAFGNGGKVVTDFGGSEEAHGVVVQPDGKVVAVGTSDAGDGVFKLAVARYTVDGDLDATFGIGGKMLTPIGGGDAVANAVAVQQDGKIVTAGYAASAKGYDFVLARYHSNGSLDRDFGTDGLVTTAIGSGSDVALALAIQVDSRIVVVGSNAGNDGHQLALARYLPDGSLDSTLGIAGTISDPDGQIGDAITVSVQADGAILVTSVNGPSFVVARYSASGQVDTSFGLGGRTVMPRDGGIDRVNGLVVRGDGRLAVAGNANGRFAFAEHGPDGSLDLDLSANGAVTTTFGGSEGMAYAITFGITSHLVVAGHADYNFALARFETNSWFVAPPPATSMAAPAVTLPSDVALFDNFDDANKGVMPVGPSGRGYLLSYDGGEYSIRNLTWYHPLVLIPGTYSDSSLTIDARLSGPLNNSSFIVLGCRSRLTSNSAGNGNNRPTWYAFEIRFYPSDGRVLLWRGGPNGAQLASRISTAARTGGPANMLGLNCLLDTISFSVNGEMVISVADRTLSSGTMYIGASMWGAEEARFDNLIVTQPGAARTADSPMVAASATTRIPTPSVPPPTVPATPDQTPLPNSTGLRIIGLNSPVQRGDTLVVRVQTRPNVSCTGVLTIPIVNATAPHAPPGDEPNPASAPPTSRAGGLSSSQIPSAGATDRDGIATLSWMVPGNQVLGFMGTASIVITCDGDTVRDTVVIS